MSVSATWRHDIHSASSPVFVHCATQGTSLKDPLGSSAVWAVLGDGELPRRRLPDSDGSDAGDSQSSLTVTGSVSDCDLDRRPCLVGSADLTLGGHCLGTSDSVELLANPVVRCLSSVTSATDLKQGTTHSPLDCLTPGNRRGEGWSLVRGEGEAEPWQGRGAFP